MDTSTDRHSLALKVRNTLFGLALTQHSSEDTIAIVKNCRAIALQIKDSRLENLVLLHEAILALKYDNVQEARRRLFLALDVADSLIDDSQGFVLPTINSKKTRSSIDVSDWSSFQDTFSMRWPNFLASLSHVSSCLTRMEIKICMLLFTGRGNKEIGKILGTSLKTVENHRGRIRPKLGLVKGQDLDTFLQKLSR